MFLAIRIKELREQQQLLQRQLAAELEIDTPMYSKLERGERKAKREQVVKMAKLFEVDKEKLIALWLAGQVFEIIKDEKGALDALKIVVQTVENK